MKQPWRNGNRLTLLCNGEAYFPALRQALAAAQYEIFLESYLFEADEVGLPIIADLIAAAQRGVAVHLLLDGFGARDLPQTIQDELKASGVALMFFSPERSTFALKRSRLRRLHRKLVSIDGSEGFVGGINILSDFDAPDLPPRYDFALQVHGPLATDIRGAALQMWQRTARRQLKLNLFRAALSRPALPAAHDGDASARLVIRDNVRHRRDIEKAYLAAIRGARDEIIIANAYFLPGITIRRALLDAAKRGVRVTLLLQGRIDQFLLHHATRTLYGPLLGAGVHIHEYIAGMMHAKVAVIDQRWSTIGSSNIDPLSLLVAREANIVARHPPLAKALRDNLLAHIKEKSSAVTLSSAPLTGWRRVLPWFSYQIIRFALRICGYGRNEYLRDD